MSKCVVDINVLTGVTVVKFFRFSKDVPITRVNRTLS